MQPLIWDRRPDGLRAPAMVCAFQGWNDAGDAASSAVSFLASTLHASRFAQIDSEEFYDFQANRPNIQLTDGQTREIVWPTVEVFEARAPRAPRDLVIVQGVEPSLRWRAFSAHLVELAEAPAKRAHLLRGQQSAIGPTGGQSRLPGSAAGPSRTVVGDRNAAAARHPPGR